MHTICRCGWVSIDWPTVDQARYEATWHVYRTHHDWWVGVYGEQPPIDPEPYTETPITI